MLYSWSASTLDKLSFSPLFIVSPFSLQTILSFNFDMSIPTDCIIGIVISFAVVRTASYMPSFARSDSLIFTFGFDLKLPSKGLVGIIGPSGSGKSTLMYCLSTLKKPTDGQI
ncbi:MAG: ATP-binding cassette domain-containing protein, partial [Paludibacteraceae bacterium]|nr:ATP-binding cassette domain-containing protein [Paludibacteraceae bacterium]